ncbi:MAG TPA: hypothetical protein VL173_03385 [Vicinamibacterales bacterium]|nr:hypothetical protein [Vicinamibacterales bacterium]
MDDYVETGGLFWGSASWRFANLTSPFAQIRVSAERVLLTVKPFPFSKVIIDLPKSHIEAIRPKRLTFNRGLQLEHRSDECPPFILFLTFTPEKLIDELRRDVGR